MNPEQPPTELAFVAVEVEFCLGVFWRAGCLLLRDTGVRGVSDGRLPGVRDPDPAAFQPSKRTSVPPAGRSTGR